MGSASPNLLPGEHEKFLKLEGVMLWHLGVAVEDSGCGRNNGLRKARKKGALLIAKRRMDGLGDMPL